MNNLPSKDEFLKGIAEYSRHEKRDPMYKVATRLVKNSWGIWDEVSDGLGVLLLTWNQACYRYGIFDFDKLEAFLNKRQGDLNKLRDRSIETLDKADEDKIRTLFTELLTALASKGKAGKFKKSPVAVAKALHILAPYFFPIWDNAIANAYGCHWMNSEKAAEKYIDFCWKNKALVEHIKGLNIPDEKKRSWLKLIDEYNYAKFTYQWI